MQMIDIKQLFYGRCANKKALEEFGFVKSGNAYKYSQSILDGQFRLYIRVEGEKVATQVYDTEAESEYFLHTVESAEGTFVGEVRAEYERVLTALSDKCFSRAEIYREKTTKAVLKYAKSKYGTPSEFLWDDENSIMRRKDNRKWYILVMIVERKKIGLEGEGKIEIIDLLGPKDEIPKLLDGVNYLPAYHMNKKSWFTVPLDGRVSEKVLFALVDMSYELAGGKSKCNK